MLVLLRKAGEAIVLNGIIHIYVLAVEGERVKLGIDAPPDVIIVRQELLNESNDGTVRQAKCIQAEELAKPTTVREERAASS